MEKVKTYSDILTDKENDAKMLAIFNDIYEKFSNLSEQELKYIIEGKSDNINGDVKSIDAEISTLQNEGVIGGLIGGLGGIIAGDKLGMAICKALGVTTGPLYSLLTSKLIITAICTYLGIKM